MAVDNKKTVFILVALVVLTALVYSPGLYGIFLFDDLPNLVNNRALVLQDFSPQSLIRASFSSDSGPLSRPISMLSFALNLEACGYSPFCFKLTNLIIHIVTGLLVFFISRLLVVRYKTLRGSYVNDTTASLLAAGVALAWLLHPVNLTSVLYVVQRMNSLSACIVLLGMLLYVLGREALLRGQGGRGFIMAAFLMTLPAMLAKENGALLPLFLLLIEVFFYRFRMPQQSDRRLLGLAFILTVLLPALCFAGFVLMQPDWLTGRYASREFDLGERLLTQARVFWLYIGLILVPTNQRLSLFHDYLPVSHGLLEPVSTVFALLGVAAVIASIWLLRKKVPLLSFGIAFFVAGHLIESTVFPLEMVFEHRNYLPSLGLIIPLVYYLFDGLISVKTASIRRMGLVSLILLFGLVTALRAAQWGNPVLLVELEAQTNPDSARVNHSAGVVYATLIDHVPHYERDHFYVKAQTYFSRVTALDENHLGGMASQIILAGRQDARPDPVLFSNLIRRLELKKITATDVGVVRKLLACVEKDVCDLEVDDTRDLAAALDRNGHLKGKFAAIIFSLLSKHYWNHLVDSEGALTYSKKALAARPDEVILWLSHARLLAALGQTENAEQALNAARDRDHLNIYATSIKKIESQLMN